MNNDINKPLTLPLIKQCSQERNGSQLPYLTNSRSSPELSLPNSKSTLNRPKGKKNVLKRSWHTIENPISNLPQSKDGENKLPNPEQTDKKYLLNGCDFTKIVPSSLNDLSAMSVINLYKSGENLDDMMNTVEGFTDHPVPNFKIHPVPPIPTIEMGNHFPTKPCCSEEKKKCPQPTIFFKDGLKSVDFILVWDRTDEEAVCEEGFKRRQIFENNLEKEGLIVEREEKEENGLNFVKIHAPKEVLRRYSEILKLRMPMKPDLCKLPRQFQLNIISSPGSYLAQKIPGLRQVSRSTNILVENVKDQWEKVKQFIFTDDIKFPRREQRFTAIYSRDREYLFDIDSPCFFTPAIHSRIVQFILDRKRFTENVSDDFGFGIEKLISDKIYSAAYPLHDGDLKTEGSIRYLLFQEWASLSKWYRYQPLDCIKEYFGVKIALYFAWLGFYTSILFPPALVGLACFVYSLATLNSDKPSQDICNLNLTEKMCPLCDTWCDYWSLKESCVHARITYLFDNPTTVFFAVFMSFWATLFLEMWKRYSAEITHRWDLTGFDVQEEHPRPQYLARLAHVKRKQVNIVTNTMEPLVPFWKIKVPMTIFSFSVVVLLVSMSLATVVAVVLYRMSLLVALKVHSDKLDRSYVILFTTATAASINLVTILIFNQFYTYVAEYLTEFECLRTQTEFDDSLTLKIYLLQFVNYYASIFYIAFFKGKYVGSPKQYNRFFGYRQEECGPGGCLMELCIQLAVIMIGKQAMNTVLEMIFPLFWKWLNILRVNTGLTKENRSLKGTKPQWLKDFKLVEWGPRSLFPEYLEMVLQYGFVTIFVAAFPLAPFFALLNNILEMRLDAKKLLTLYRKPVSQRVSDIGVWYRILDSIGKLSVVTNGFIIAFTSQFIPRLVYRIAISQDGSLEGYLNNSLSYFKTSDFPDDSASRNTTDQFCRYPDYRHPPGHSEPYALSSLYWHILAARLAFVVIFENLVVIVMIILKWLIPDMPSELRDRIRREAYITNEIIIKQETLRAQSEKRERKIDKKQTEQLLNVHEDPSTPEQWDRLISKSLSGSEFDLLVHSTSKDKNCSKEESPSSI